MKRVGMYARVSPGHQEKEQTIESQIAEIEGRVAAMGARLDPEHRYIDDGWLSDVLQRPALEAMRDAVALGSLDCIVMLDPDRLSRNFVNQQVVLEEIERKKVEVVFVKGGVARTDEERMMLGVRGLFAEYEHAKILDRTRRGRLFRARHGAPPGWSNPPYGYRYLPGDKPRLGTIVVEECEARTVRQIFRWIGVEGLRLRQVAMRLESRRVKTRKGGHWGVSTLGGIVRNPVYKGQAHHQKYEAVEPKEPRDRHRFRRRRKTSTRRRPESEWISVPAPAIVDAALFDKAQQQLAENRRKTAGQVKHEHLLRGLLVCTTCGRTMWAFGNGYGTRHERRYYGCNKEDPLGARYDRRCSQRPVRADEVESVVWEDLAHWLQEPEQLAAQLEAQREKVRTLLDAHTASQRERGRELRRIATKIGRLVDAYEAGAIPLDELRARRERLEEHRKDCEAQIAQADRERDHALGQQQVVDELQHLKERLRHGLERCTFQDRRAIVELLVEKVEVADPVLRIHYFVPLGSTGRGSQGPTQPPSGQAGEPGRGLFEPCPRGHDHDHEEEDEDERR